MPYQIVKSNKLSDTQIRDINNLVSLCNRHDRLQYSFDPNDNFKKKADINHFLLYDADKLLSVVILFTPRNEAEVSAFTHPEFRRKGLFSSLLSAAAAELSRRRIPDFLFVCDKSSQDGQKVVTHLKAVYEYSEFAMKLNPEKIPDLTMDPALQIRETKPADRPTLIKIRRASFRDQTDESFMPFFLAENRVVHTLFYHHEIIGLIAVYDDGQKYYIHGFAIDPPYRGKGLGGQALHFIVKKFRNLDPRKDIELEVQTENIRALSLYEKIGFKVFTAYDYSRLPLKNYTISNS
ncbi:MAG: GNAT family N-acetyltransferase [Desulfobacteraceae bacterium]|nr:MAG: GNAT family N-acetyltransferase [Desulfobacteraceae bacterium]